MSKKAIMAVSFGTSYEETRKLTIEAFEQSLAEHFANLPLYRAWTSGMIIKKIRERDGIIVNKVSEALQQIKEDGFDEILVQPSHILEGMEYEKIVEQLTLGKSDFESIKLGRGLLYDDDSYIEVSKAISDIFSDVTEKEALLLVGHGSSHKMDISYEKLEKAMSDAGHKNFIIGTIEGNFDMERAISKLKEISPDRVRLAPLLIVAGDHALNDIGGDDEDSYKMQLKAAGFDVKCVLKGLGEYRQIRDIFIRRAENAKEL